MGSSLASTHVPWTDDDARFYVPAAAEYAKWFERVISGDIAALTKKSIVFSRTMQNIPRWVNMLWASAGWYCITGSGLTDAITACHAGIPLSCG
ncbi:MAG: hypothetical protein R3C68_07240 [Myxococcota bacterium]